VDWPDIAGYFPERIVRSGEWLVRERTLTEYELHVAKLRDVIQMTREAEGVVAGRRYINLVHRHTIVMSDTPMELRTMEEAVSRARGRVLVGGLGLGIVTLAMLAKSEVEHVTVLERSDDVRALVEPRVPLPPDRVTVVTADVFKWKPEAGEQFDTVWMDIWSDIPNYGNIHQMTRLKRRFSRHLAPGGWFGCWREDDAWRDAWRYEHLTQRRR
jgi:spermidine synthase